MKMLYSYQTSKGLASIRFNPLNNRYHAFFTDESLGSYASPELALGDIVGGHLESHTSGVDTALLNIPDALCDWVRTS